MKRLFEQKKREIGFLTLFFGIILSFAWDRIYFFAYLNEDAGWRQVSEIGVLMSRGTAAALSFIYPCMLLSMSKNIMTILRRDLIDFFIIGKISLYVLMIVQSKAILFLISMFEKDGSDSGIKFLIDSKSSNH